MVERAQRHMIEAGLTSRGVAHRYAQLSRELLEGAEPAAAETLGDAVITPAG